MQAEDFDIVTIGKRRFWQWPDGSLRPVVSGGADDTDEDEDEDEDDDEDSDETDKPKKGKSFTQRQVNAVATREKREGKKAGKNELLKALGYATEEELKEAIEAKQEADAKKPDPEVDKERKKLDREKAETKAEREAAAKDRHAAKVERFLLKGGASLSKLERLSRLIDIEVGADDDEIEDAIDSLKEELPELFSSNSSDDDEEDKPRSRSKGTDTRRKNPDSNPGRKASPKGSKSIEDKVKERLAQRNPGFAKTS